MKKDTKTQKTGKSQKKITQMRSFLQNHKSPETKIFAFCVVTFESIKI